ncbi:D-2-hydroxyacid dehydrogenase [Aestuariivivens sediminicola]|uniref:D-2-hydroxyacid dehydrogenase n=1 Tax=Aestuariivivens sediminicola TaxID=2913560 RepID=UPI001F565863|nr:D-2-hydroxyacid dehydrogenase [Aestuariivivens sediminicola]
MKIVVLDGYTLNPGDLSWEGLEEFGEVIIYDRTAYNTEAILKNIDDATCVFTNKTPLEKAVLRKAKLVKYIGVLATGYNVVDVREAHYLGITVTNVPAYSTAAVAQFTMALLLEICHHVGAHNRAVKNGDWSNALDFSFWNFPLMELEGKTLGIIGFGRIGQATAKLANAFGLNVLFNSRSRKNELETENCVYADLDKLLAHSDIISLHCPLLERTEGIINSKNIDKMKDEVIIINTSRGGLIKEKELAEALNSGKVYAAAVDVVSSEPIDKNNPLLKAKNCIITPHIAWASFEARKRLMQLAIKNFEHYLNDDPINVVSS